MRFALLLSVAAVSLAGPVFAADEQQAYVGQPIAAKASPDLKISKKEAQEMLRKNAKADALIPHSPSKSLISLS